MTNNQAIIHSIHSALNEAADLELLGALSANRTDREVYRKQARGHRKRAQQLKADIEKLAA